MLLYSQGLPVLVPVCCGLSGDGLPALVPACYGLRSDGLPVLIPARYGPYSYGLYSLPVRTWVGLSAQCAAPFGDL